VIGAAIKATKLTTGRQIDFSDRC